MNKIKLIIEPSAAVLATTLIVSLWAYPTETFLLLAAIILHELAHALTAELHGYPVCAIKLFWAFAVGYVRPNPSIRRRVALAGPLFSIVAFFLLGLNHYPLAAAANLIVFVVSILPFPGSDSWRMFAK